MAIPSTKASRIFVLCDTINSFGRMHQRCQINSGNFACCNWAVCRMTHIYVRLPAMSIICARTGGVNHQHSPGIGSLQIRVAQKSNLEYDVAKQPARKEFVSAIPPGF